MTIKKLAVVIPTFNRKEVTRNLVTNLLMGTFDNLSIIICDSNSSDGTRDEFTDHPFISVINVGEESWWTGSVNKGIELALRGDYEFVLVLNDDIDIPKNLVQVLLNKAALNPGKIISPVQGKFFGIIYQGILKLPIFARLEGINDQVTVSSSNGCCLLIPTYIFAETGLFDDVRCPHLYGDTEFQLRASNYGHSTVVTANAMITQHEPTDYYCKVRICDLFTFKGSPAPLFAYLAFGHTLFQGWIKFFIFGVYHHYMFLRTLAKTLYLIIARNK